MNRWIFLVAALLAGFGCASSDKRELAYAPATDSGAFVPVQLVMNRKAPVPRKYIDRVSAAEAELSRSGLFAQIGPGVASEYLLEVSLERGTHESVAEAAVHVLSAATLFLVPSRVRNFNLLKADLYVQGQLRKSYAYQDEFQDPLSAFDWTETNEFVSIKNVVRKFMMELDRDQLIPRQSTSAF